MARRQAVGRQGDSVLVKVLFSGAGGEARWISAEVGQSLMSAAKASGVPGIEAICGGSMVCGTCHVYVDEAWLGRLEPPSAAEQVILEGTLEPRPNSRLACQIRLSEAHEGLSIAVPDDQI